MRYIQKDESPAFFEECKNNLPENPNWDQFEENQDLGQCKQRLKQHLLAEQSSLCVYCERKIHLNIEQQDQNGVMLSFQQSNCHFEHVMPKDSYPALAFDYENLTLSCNGDQCSSEQNKPFKPQDVHSCGHKKGKIFNEEDFLNPVSLLDIADFFAYELTSCSITSSDKNKVRADKTIELLNLNNARLNNERHNARTTLSKVFKEDIENKNFNRIKAYLGKNPAFVSFLSYWLKSTNKTLFD